METQIVNLTESRFSSLPAFIEHEITYDIDEVRSYRFFLCLNKDVHGQWSCGYVYFGGDTEEEMAIPELVTNGSVSLDEAATRMIAKVERYNKRHNVRSK